jgi:hypothetical protein
MVWRPAIVSFPTTPWSKNRVRQMVYQSNFVSRRIAWKQVAKCYMTKAGRREIERHKGICTDNTTGQINSK